MPELSPTAVRNPRSPVLGKSSTPGASEEGEGISECPSELPVLEVRRFQCMQKEPLKAFRDGLRAPSNKT